MVTFHAGICCPGYLLCPQLLLREMVLGKLLGIGSLILYSNHHAWLSEDLTTDMLPLVNPTE